MDNLSAAPWKSGRLATSTRLAYPQIKYIKPTEILCERVVRKALAGETIVAMRSTTSTYSERVTIAKAVLEWLKNFDLATVASWMLIWRVAVVMPPNGL